MMSAMEVVHAWFIAGKACVHFKFIRLRKEVNRLKNVEK